MSDSNITIRAMEPEDLDLLYKIENNHSLWGVGVTNVPYSRYSLHDYIANASNDIYTDRQVRFMIDNEAGNTVGIVDIVNFEPSHLRAELGIVIEKKYRGKGYAKESLKLVIDYSQKVLHLHQLYVVVSVDNNKAVSLFESLGFKRGAELKEWLYDGHIYYDALLMQTFL